MELFREAFYWGHHYPRWYADMTKAWGFENFEEFYAHVSDPDVISMGIFNPEFIGLARADYIGDGMFEVHLLGKKGADVEALGIACAHWTQLFSVGATEIFTSVAKFNRVIKTICLNAGMVVDGVRMLKGQTHGKPIEWIRMKITKQMWSENYGR
jgi:RimJ/RimL family protein N-acetyltransferase